MAFNSEDRISYDELAPSLQAMINKTVSVDSYNALNDKLNSFNAYVNQFVDSLDGVRISIVDNLSKITNPVNNKELAIIYNTSSNYTSMYIYSAGTWKAIHAVYA